MDFDRYFKIIQQSFPNVIKNGITVLQEGNDHIVLVVNNQKAFRFPRNRDAIENTAKTFFDEVSPKFLVKVPHITIHKDEQTGQVYDTYDFIPGISFVPKVAKEFSKEELRKIASLLGQFLTQVHSFSKEKAREIGVGELDPITFWGYWNDTAFPKYKKMVFPLLSNSEQEWVTQLFENYISLIKTKPFISKVTHSDMWTYHIIVDPKQHTLSGVIDFTLRIGDPAHDFKPFEHYGKEFVKETYRSYALLRDEDFDKRRLFYTAHDIVFEISRSVELNDEKRAQRYVQLLKDYIMEHQYPF